MKLEHIAINVPDSRAAAEWYAQHLGLKIVVAADASPYMRFISDGAGSMIEFYTRTDILPPDYSQIDPFTLHLAFTVEDMAATRDALVAAGATVVDEIVTTPAGDQLLFLRDPWQVPLQILKRKQAMG